MIIRAIKDFWLGLRSYIQAFSIIYQYTLWPWFLVPIALSFLIYFGGDYLLEDLRNYNFDEKLAKINLSEELGKFRIQRSPTDPDSLEMLLVGAKLMLVIVALKLNKYIVLLFLTPMLSLISARVERRLTGNRYKFGLKQYIDDVYRGVNFVIRNLFRQALLYVGWYLLTLILPFLDVITFPYIFLVGAYYYGASLMDYTNERRRLSMEESVLFIRKHSGIALAIGSVFYGLFFISYIGIVIGPIVGVVAATYAVDQRVGLKAKNALKKALKEDKKSQKPQNTPKESDY